MDDLTLDILWNRLIATVDEQAAALMRTSFTTIVREAGDLSAGVFDRRGRMVAQAVTGTPGHINTMATGMVHFLNRFPVDTLVPGDVLITNDPWQTASQLNDITIATPIFKGDRVVALFANCCHALDIGGRGLAADSRSVFEEGLAIPVMKLYRAGQPEEALFELLKANVRTPVEVLGDIHCQVVGNRVGGQQLLAFLDEFGLADIEDLADAIIQRSEAAMGRRIAALPDGEYRHALTLDGFDAPIELRVCIAVAGERLTVDYSGSSPQVPWGINVALNYTAAYTTYGIKCALSPDVPNNEGSFRPVALRAPEGSILNAPFPAAVGGRHLVGHFLPSLIMGALANALGDNPLIAPGADGLWDTHVFGTTAQGQPFSFTWFASGGTGARNCADGLSATAYPSGIAGVPVEVMETLAPLRVLRRELAPDSGGPGHWRGGLGQTWTVAMTTGRDYGFSGLYERLHHPAPGLAGGAPGAPGQLTVIGAPTPRAKTSTTLGAQAVFTLTLPGGGGFGDPWTRDPARVQADVVAGLVSVEGARRDYGVVIDSTTLTVATAETLALRQSHRSGETEGGSGEDG